MTDFERYGIAPDDPAANYKFDVASYLEANGVPLDDIRSMRTAPELDLRAWRLNFGLEGPQISFAKAAELAGMTETQLRRFHRAVGFTDAMEDVYTEHDVETLRLLADFSSLIGEDQVVQLARVMGEGLGRMAEATADMVRVNIEGPPGQISRSEYLQLSDAIARDALPRLGRAMDRIFRYHILRVSAQDWNLEAGAKATTMQGVAGFADMVGFTAHSGALSTDELADVIDRFEGRVSETITSSGGRVIKFIGDEVLFLFSDATAACRCARDLLLLAADESIPDVRVGLAQGEVITRYGDCYGPVVNRAARLVDVAPPRSILVTPEVAARAVEFSFEPREPILVKGIDEPVENLLVL